MGIHPMTLATGALAFFVLGFAVHPVMFILAVAAVAIWGLQFAKFIFR